MGRKRNKKSVYYHPYTWRLDRRLIALIEELADKHERPVSREVAIALKRYCAEMGQPFVENENENENETGEP